MNTFYRMALSIKQRWIRLTHWEYWSMWTIYLPLAPYYLIQSIRAGGIGFFSRSNPCMPSGGMALFDKEEMYNLLPAAYYPTTGYFVPGTDFDGIKSWIENNSIEFPLVAKPAKGCRGRGVEIIHTLNDLQTSLVNCNEKMIVQALIPFKNEVGIFYVKHPKEKRGKITGIVEKKGIQITGNGINTIVELIQQSERYAIHLPYLQKSGFNLSEILPKGKMKELSSIGNHARGATFYDITHLNSEKLESVIDSISANIEHFYYGRFDIKFESWEKLEKGESFSIVELNGANSEPTHIYDPKHSYLFALNEFKKHWKMMANIAIENKTLCKNMPWKKTLKLIMEI
jgi:hypothetical protein